MLHLVLLAGCVPALPEIPDCAGQPDEPAFRATRTTVRNLDNGIVSDIMMPRGEQNFQMFGDCSFIATSGDAGGWGHWVIGELNSDTTEQALEPFLDAVGSASQLQGPEDHWIVTDGTTSFPCTRCPGDDEAETAMAALVDFATTAGEPWLDLGLRAVVLERSRRGELLDPSMFSFEMTDALLVDEEDTGGVQLQGSDLSLGHALREQMAQTSDPSGFSIEGPSPMVLLIAPLREPELSR